MPAAVDGVFWLDDRTQVTPTTTAPASMTVFISVEFPSGLKGACSGFMVGPRTVGTSGHCVYDADDGGWVKHALVIPGANGTLQPFGRALATNAHSVSGWTQNQDPRFDFGALTLDSDLGVQTGTFGMRADADATLLASDLTISGYPGDKPVATMWKGVGRIDSLDVSLLYFRLDVTGGNSGGPVWGRTSNNEYFVVGIIKGGNARTNVAVRVNPTVISQFVSWRSQAGGATPGAPVTAKPAPPPAAPRSLGASPATISARVGTVVLSLITIGATEGGGDLVVTVSGGTLVANSLLSPNSCGSGTRPCVNTIENAAAFLVIPDAGNDLRSVLLTLSGTVRVTTTVTVSAVQGSAKWDATVQVTAQAPAEAPTTRSARPFKVFGGGLQPGQVVEAFNGTASVGKATVTGAGNWQIDVQPTATANGDRITFALDGRAAAQSATFDSGQSVAPPGIGLTTTTGSAPSPTRGTGTFASTPVFSATRLANVVFNGGTVTQLDTALTEAGATGTWAQDPKGLFVLYVVGGGFVNDRFKATFSNGFASLTALTLVGR